MRENICAEGARDIDANFLTLPFLFSTHSNPHQFQHKSLLRSKSSPIRHQRRSPSNSSTEAVESAANHLKRNDKFRRFHKSLQREKRRFRKSFRPVLFNKSTIKVSFTEKIGDKGFLTTKDQCLSKHVVNCLTNFLTDTVGPKQEAKRLNLRALLCKYILS